jgi:O-acetyl-ADP-ribose deacetylase (regulator of RNase III)
MPLTIIRQSITEVDADAIVNTANPHPVVGGGTDTAVYEAAGFDALLEARKEIGDIRAGDAAVTPAFNLPYKIIIHTVSPMWADGNHGETETLRSCYLRSLEEAEKHECVSTAFPLLASGSNGFPKDIALKTALDSIQSWLMTHEMNVILAVFDKESFELSSNVYADVKSYIEEHLVNELAEKEYRGSRRRRRDMALPSGVAGMALPNSSAPWHRPGKREDAEEEKEERYNAAPVYSDAAESYESSTHVYAREAYAPDEISFSDILRGRKKEETFQVKLLQLIDESGETDPMVYKRANIERKLFAKIRKDENYKPSRKTAIALAIALKLSLPEAQDLLKRAGFSLSQSSTFDLIIRFCLEHQIYDINDVNSILFKFDQEVL